jgi:hypothetical protein
MLMDSTQTHETNNETIYVYPVGSPTDDDIMINQSVNNQTKNILLPRRMAGVAAISTKVGANGEMFQPTVYLTYNSQQYTMPLRYVYLKDKLYDFQSGLDAGIFLFPSLESQNSQMSVNSMGAAFYLSPRVVHTELAKLYLFNEPSSYFKLAHSEPDFVISDLKKQGVNVGDFLYYQGFRGPIKIWEISYPSDIKLNSTYLSIDFPPEVQTVTPGEY